MIILAVARGHARGKLYDALLKSENGDVQFVERVIRRATGLTGEQFKAKEKNLQSSHIKKILQVADTMRMVGQSRAQLQVNRFIDSNNLVGACLRARELGHTSIDPKDRELKRTLMEVVRSDPGYPHKVYTQLELAQFAKQAVEVFCKTREKQFDEQYLLSKLENEHVHDLDTYLDELEKDLERPPLSELRELGNPSVLAAVANIKTGIDALRAAAKGLEGNTLDPVGIFHPAASYGRSAGAWHRHPDARAAIGQGGRTGPDRAQRGLAGCANRQGRQ